MIPARPSAFFPPSTFDPDSSRDKIFANHAFDIFVVFDDSDSIGVESFVLSRGLLFVVLSQLLFLLLIHSDYSFEVEGIEESPLSERLDLLRVDSSDMESVILRGDALRVLRDFGNGFVGVDDCLD